MIGKFQICLARFQSAFDRSLDTVVFDDRKVSHYVSEMTKIPSKAAERAVLLVDYDTDVRRGVS